MAETLVYEDLEIERVDAALARDGELLLALPETRARACIAFIEAVRASKSLGASPTPFLKRLWSLTKGASVTLRVLFTHPKLFELGRVVVLNTSSQTWTQSPNGTFLFRFAK